MVLNGEMMKSTYNRIKNEINAGTNKVEIIKMIERLKSEYLDENEVKLLYKHLDERESRIPTLDDFKSVDNFIDICFSAGEAESIPEAKEARKSWARILHTFGKQEILETLNK